MVEQTAARDPNAIPPVLLKAIGAFLLTVLVLVAAARLSGMEPAAMPPQAEPVQSRMIVLTPRADQGVIVSQADGTLIADLTPVQAGFIAGVQRALVRARGGENVTAPVELLAYADGRMALLDPRTGWRVQLVGFGKDNYAAFARLLATDAGTATR